MTEPGRLISLGEEEDLIDARGLLDVALACRDMRDRRKAGTTHIANQALWSFWEMPRMGARVDSKYPKAWPWSPEARHRYQSNAGRKPVGGWQLVYEHVRPRGIIAGGIIEGAHTFTPASLVAHLNHFMAGAVITKAEDRLFHQAKVARSPLDVNDPDVWTRYRTAGLDPDTFAPLDPT